MSEHIEWMDAKGCFVEALSPEEIEDAYGSVNEQPALVIAGGGGAAVVIEGSKDEILAFLARAEKIVKESL